MKIMRVLKSSMMILLPFIVIACVYQRKPLDRQAIFQEINNFDLSKVELPEGTQKQVFDFNDGINLDEAILIGITQNPNLVAERIKLGIADAQIAISGQLDNPTLALDLTEARVDKIKTYEWELVQNMAGLLTRNMKVSRAKIKKKAVEFELKKYEQEIINEIKKKYLDVLYKQMLHENALESKKISDELKDVIKEKFNAGKLSYPEFISTNMESIKFNQALLITATELELAEHLLSGLLGFPSEYKFKITPTEKFEELLDQKLTISELKTFAAHKRLDLLIIEANYELSEKDLAIAYAGRIPGLEFGLQYDDSKGKNDAKGIVLGVNIPIWNWRNGEIKEGKAQRTFIEKQLRSAIISIILEVQLANLKLELSQKMLAVHKESLLDKSKSNFELTQEAYQLGKVALFQILMAKNQYISSKRDYIDFVYQCKSNLIELEKVVGGTNQQVAFYIEKIMNIKESEVLDEKKSN